MRLKFQVEKIFLENKMLLEKVAYLEARNEDIMLRFYESKSNEKLSFRMCVILTFFVLFFSLNTWRV